MPSPLRHHWSLADDVTFLNHGSFGATPRAVLAFQQQLRDEMEREPVQFLWRRLPERLDAARAALARFLAADPGNLAFVTNATAAVNAVLRSVELGPGDEVLTTDHAYNACRNALDETCARQGARVVVAPIPFPLASEDEAVDAILGAVSERTRLAMIDHVTSPTALVLPVARLVRELETRGIETLVDGAHAPGMLELDLEGLRPAWYTGNLHKWVCAPKGAAFLWTRPDRHDTLRPPVISHGWNTPRPGSSRYHDLFDWTGTFDPTPWLAVPEAIDFVAGLHPGGWAGVRERNRALLLESRDDLLDMLELEPPCPPGMLACMATLPLPERFAQGVAASPDPLQIELHDRHRIEVPIHAFSGRRWFRISVHLHNDPDDHRRLGEVLSAL